MQFAQRKDPQDCALLFIALGKKGQLQGLFKAVQNEKLQTFLANDFSTPRWRSAALKNAYALLSKQQHELAAAFFLLGADLESAVRVCARQLGDLQLALVLCRLRAAEAPDLQASILRDEVLPYADERQDGWLSCVAHLILDEPGSAIEALTSRRPTPLEPSSGYAGGGAGRCGLLQGAPFDPSALAFVKQILDNPRHRLRLPGGQVPTSLIYDCGYAYAHRGCGLLAMEALCSNHGQLVCKGEDATESDGHDSAAATQWRLVLAARHLMAFAEHLVIERSDATPSGHWLSPTAVQLARAHDIQQALLDECRILLAHLHLPEIEIREQLVRGCATLGHSLFVLPRLLLLSAMEEWTACRTLLAQAARGLVHTDTWPGLPCLLEGRKRQRLLHVSTVLLLGLDLIPDGALPDGANSAWAVWSHAAHLASVAVACSSCDFEALLVLTKWSPGQPLGEAVPAAFQRLAEASSGARMGSDSPATPSTQYVWTRLVALVLHTLWQQHQQHGQQPRRATSDAGEEDLACGSDATPSRPPPLFGLPDSAGVGSPHGELLACWLGRACLRSRSIAATLPLRAFPLDGMSATAATALPSSQQFALSKLWATSSASADEASLHRADHADADAAQRDAPPVTHLWPRDDEVCGMDSHDAKQHEGVSLQLSAPTQLVYRRGEFVRSVCVNALNPRQLAVSLGRGVQQVELAAPQLADSPMRAGDPDQAGAVVNQWAAWGIGIRNAATLNHPVLASPHADFNVQQNSGSDLPARCLCSHPKVIASSAWSAPPTSLRCLTHGSLCCAAATVPCWWRLSGAVPAIRARDSGPRASRSFACSVSPAVCRVGRQPQVQPMRRAIRLHRGRRLSVPVAFPERGGCAAAVQQASVSRAEGRRPVLCRQLCCARHSGRVGRPGVAEPVRLGRTAPAFASADHLVRGARRGWMLRTAFARRHEPDQWRAEGRSGHL